MLITRDLRCRLYPETMASLPTALIRTRKRQREIAQADERPLHMIRLQTLSPSVRAAIARPGAIRVFTPDPNEPEAPPQLATASGYSPP